MDLYLLGAGFSSDAGVPTMKTFVCGMKEAQSSFPEMPLNAVFERAIGYAGSAGSDNIEDLLTRSVNNPVFFDLIRAFGLTVNYFSRRFLDSVQAKEDIGWYDDFALLAAASRPHILTFNYDLIVEELLWWRAGCVEDYRIDFDETRNKPSLRHSLCRIPLYKLHGSVSWLWCLKCCYTVNGYRHLLPAVYEDAPCPRCTSPLIPLIVPPTYRKMRQPAAVLDRLRQQADRLLGRAERIIVGGLSLADRDRDVRRRFINGVKKNSYLREIVLVNRDEETCRAIGSLIPAGIPWRMVAGFPEYCRGPNVRPDAFLEK